VGTIAVITPSFPPALFPLKPEIGAIGRGEERSGETWGEGGRKLLFVYETTALVFKLSISI